MRAKPKKDTSYQLLKHTTQHTTTQRKAQHNTTQNTTHTPNNALPPLTCCSHDVRSSQDQRSREKTGACTSASPELMDMLASCSNCITRNKNGKGTEEKKRKAGTKKKSKKKSKEQEQKQGVVCLLCGMKREERSDKGQQGEWHSFWVGWLHTSLSCFCVWLVDQCKCAIEVGLRMQIGLHKRCV